MPSRNKRCSKCAKTKSTNEFYRHARNRDGYNSQCKKCRVASNIVARNRHREAFRKRHREYWRMIRREAVKIIGRGKLECVICGCNNLKILEINHKDLNSRRKRKEKGTSVIFNVYRGRRTIDDLDLRCKVCNLLHYLETVYGKLPYEVKYKLAEGIK